MRSAAEYLESLSPWPEEGFGLDRMRALLDRLGNPQLAYPSIHVVGTNGKSTVTRMIEELLATSGLATGAYLSPHVRRWSERIRVRGAEAHLEQALARVRPAADELRATQFEVLTAAALAEFAAARVDAAVVEAGLGGRHDATNVLRSPVQVLTNVSLEHTEVLGDTREAIAAEKLAVVQPGSTVVLGEPEWEGLAREQGAAEVLLAPAGNLDLATTAAALYLGRPVDPARAENVRLPGRLERRGSELWDGAHTVAGAERLVRLAPRRDYALVGSVLSDKDVEGILERLRELGPTFVATSSSNARALPAQELAHRAQTYFEHVEAVPQPTEALARARELAGRSGAVLVTGSLYLLADLSAAG